MAEHTPTTETVRDCFVDGAAGEFIGEDFDRWLGAHDAELRAEVERLRREVAAGIETERESNATARRLLAEARQQVADLRAGIEALLPGETVNVHAGGGNLVSQRRVVNPDRLRALLAGSGEQPGEAVGTLRVSDWPDGKTAEVRLRPAPVVPDVVRELDAVMHHHADRADAAEAEVERLRGVERGWQHDRSEWEKERDEARQQVADLRAGIEAAVVTLNREAYRQPTPWIDRLASDLRTLLAQGEGS